jgi:hypothetical protein
MDRIKMPAKKEIELKHKHKDVECAYTINMPADDAPLPKLPVDSKEKQEFISKRGIADLLADTIIIGRRYKKFREFFAEYGDLVEELRNNLPKSGKNCKIGIRMPSGIITPYLWSEFCEEFFGVCSETVRQELQRRKRWQDDIGVDEEMEEAVETIVDAPKTKISPQSDNGKNLIEEAEEAKSQAAIATLGAAVSQVEATKAKTVAINYELAYRRLLDEMNSLLDKVEEYGEQCPVPVTDYIRKMQPRLCTIQKIAAGAELVASTPTTPTPPVTTGGELVTDEEELDEAAELYKAMAMAASANALGEEVL